MLPKEVKDRATFIAFVEALAEEREKAEEMERESVILAQFGSALRWQNHEISSFLKAALACFSDGLYRDAVPEEPSWQGFAEFLYFGKIYE